MNRPPLPWLALTLLAAPALAQEPPADAAPGAGGFLEAPSVVASPVTPDGVEPDITIREEGGSLVYEYRVNGQLYMIRIQPQFGPPYFLVDTDGDGFMDDRRGDPRDIRIPQWILFSWD
jgi:hypothetical protein